MDTQLLLPVVEVTTLRRPSLSQMFQCRPTLPEVLRLTHPADHRTVEIVLLHIPPPPLTLQLHLAPTLTIPRLEAATPTPHRAAAVTLMHRPETVTVHHRHQATALRLATATVPHHPAEVVTAHLHPTVTAPPPPVTTALHLPAATAIPLEVATVLPPQAITDLLHPAAITAHRPVEVAMDRLRVATVVRRPDLTDQVQLL